MLLVVIGGKGAAHLLDAAALVANLEHLHRVGRKRPGLFSSEAQRNPFVQLLVHVAAHRGQLFVGGVLGQRPKRLARLHAGSEHQRDALEELGQGQAVQEGPFHVLLVPFRLVLVGVAVGVVDAVAHILFI